MGLSLSKRSYAAEMRVFRPQMSDLYTIKTRIRLRKSLIRVFIVMHLSVSESRSDERRASAYRQTACQRRRHVVAQFFYLFCGFPFMYMDYFTLLAIYVFTLSTEQHCLSFFLTFNSGCFVHSICSLQLPLLCSPRHSGSCLIVCAHFVFGPP